MRLALKVGRLDWRKALSELSPQEFIEWMAFERVEPFGQEWHQTSVIAAAVVNEIRGIAAGLGGQAMKEENAMDADHYVPGVAARKAADEAKAAERTLRGMVGL